jgi:hypothetical protein
MQALAGQGHLPENVAVLHDGERDLFALSVYLVELHPALLEDEKPLGAVLWGVEDVVLLEEGIRGALGQVLHLLFGEGTQDVDHGKQAYLFFEGHRHELRSFSPTRNALDRHPLRTSPDEPGRKESARIRKSVWYVSPNRSTFRISVYGSPRRGVAK